MPAKKTKTEEQKPTQKKPKEAAPAKPKIEEPKRADKPQTLPELNIGMVGHVDHGKTTLTQALSGKWTDTHSEEIKRGITIKIGYADVTFVKTKDGKYMTEKTAKLAGLDYDVLRTVSLVDAPGHETLMATVLSGTSIMDGALLLIAANQNCPQPQTREHLTTLDISGIRNIVIVQNKIDLVDKEQALKNYNQIKEFVKGTVAESAPIIPVSAQRGINIDILVQTIQERIPTPKKESDKPPKMLIVRSFDVNKPGQDVGKLSGSVVGGSLVQGELKVGDEIEIKPGVKIKDKYQPLRSKITGLHKSGESLEKAGHGGLLGLSTQLDPYLAKADNLAGNVLGLPGKLPQVLEEISIKTNLLDRVIGSKEELNVEPIKTNEPLMLTVGTTRTVGVVFSSGSLTKVKLKLPVCADKGDRVAISRQISGRWRLVGWGQIN